MSCCVVFCGTGRISRLSETEYEEMSNCVEIEQSEWNDVMEMELTYDFFICGCPVELHLPLWRQSNYMRRMTSRKSDRNKVPKSMYRRARSNLWSGQRKRQGVEV